MNLKEVKRYVKYLNRLGILEIVDTQYDGDSDFGREYKVDLSNCLYVGSKHYGKVIYYTHMGELVEESNTLYWGIEMVYYSGIVKWNGDHYFSGDEVRGSKIEWRGSELWLYDDDDYYVVGIGDLTRYEWVEISPESLEVLE